MSTVHHYHANIRDLFFNLFEALEIQKTSLGRAPFSGSLDEAGVRDALSNLAKLCTEEIAASFAATDREPPVMDAEGKVHLPKVLTDAVQAYLDGEWHLLEVPEHLGGVGAPPSVLWAAFELGAGSNPIVCYYLFGTFIAMIIERLGTESQRKLYVENMLKRHWGGAMVLTEPDAGSDVGAGRAKAKHIDGDIWEIEGVKRFITNGDYEGVENIVHLVLARPEGAAGGTKGLSMFIVPKYWVNEDGSLGERNGFTCAKLEKKMGIKGSVTCEMVYGQDKPARGLLVGGVHDGIRQMFHVIEQARMAVGMKSMATLSAAYFNALSYAKDRIQGPDLAHALDKNSPRVPIIKHPDVRRMLMMQKSHAEGMRALALYTAWVQDQVTLLGGHGNKNADAMDRLNDMLLPLVKGYSSEKGFELLSISLQCFGGAGYTQDFPAEQYLRDQRIDALYEGTTHIQSLDLIFRKIARDGGATLTGLLSQAQAIVQENQGGEAFAEERALLGRALMDLQALFMAIMGKINESVYHVGLQGNRILLAVSEVVIGWLLVKHALIAASKLEGSSGDERAFYEGKIASARFFCREVLPGITLTRKLVENSKLDIMNLRDEIF